MFGDDDIVPYLPDKLKPFAQQLKDFPAHYEKWVYAPAVRSTTYQGDVFAEVPFVSVDENGDTVRFELPGMVVSNTCDAQPTQGDSVLVAPVIDLASYKEKSELKGDELNNHLLALTENKISNLMFLPNGHGTSDSFVDFGSLCSVSSTHFHRERSKKRIVSLSLVGHYLFLVKLAYHFTRPESADVVR